MRPAGPYEPISFVAFAVADALVDGTSSNDRQETLRRS
jgi:hypothetical protein